MEYQASILLFLFLLFHPSQEVAVLANTLPQQNHRNATKQLHYHRGEQAHEITISNSKEEQANEMTIATSKGEQTNRIRIPNNKGEQENGITVAHSSLLRCIPGSGELETMQATAHYLMDLRPDFRYVQVTLRMQSCFHHPVYRGSTFITNRDVLPRGSSPQAKVTLSYARRPDGSHTYQLDAETLGLHQIVNTSDNCGEFQGFRIRTQGAQVCELQWPNNNNLGIKVGQTKVQAKFSISTLHDLRRWANGAYVMAICFTLTTYTLFLVASYFQKRVQYTVVAQESV